MGPYIPAISSQVLYWQHNSSYWWMCPFLDPSLSNVGSNLLCQLPVKRHRHHCAVVTALVLPGDLLWPGVSHSTLHHTSIHHKPHLSCLLFHTPLLGSDIPHFSIWCLFQMLFPGPFACCCTAPLWKKGGHSTHSLPGSPSQLQDGKPDGAAKLFSSWEKGSSSHAGGSGKSEAEVPFLISQRIIELCAEGLGQGATREPHLRVACWVCGASASRAFNQGHDVQAGFHLPFNTQPATSSFPR